MRHLALALILAAPLPAAIYLGATWSHQKAGDMGSISFSGYVPDSVSLDIEQHGAVLVSTYRCTGCEPVTRRFLAMAPGIGQVGLARVLVFSPDSAPPETILADVK